jgi:hypothetical protein
MKIKQLLALAASTLLLTSCKKADSPPESCAVSVVETAAVTGWDASPYCFATPVAGGQYQTYVINSAAELQALNHCTTTPTIDFDRYTLLAGKTKTAACSSVKTQRVVRRCAQYTFEVVLAAGLCQASTEVLYYTLVPKLAAGEQVTSSVTLPR